MKKGFYAVIDREFDDLELAYLASKEETNRILKRIFKNV